MSRRIIAMQKQKKQLYKKFLLTRSSTEPAKHHDRLYTQSLRRSRAAYKQNVIETAISNPKILFRYDHGGTKERDHIPGLRRPDGSIETNDEEKAQILANHFQTVYTRETQLSQLLNDNLALQGQCKTLTARVKFLEDSLEKNTASSNPKVVSSSSKCKKRRLDALSKSLSASRKKTCEVSRRP